MILSNFWTDADHRVQAVEIGAWLNTLAGLTAAEILQAYEDYQRSGPRQKSGRLEKPQAYDIKKIAMLTRSDAEKARRFKQEQMQIEPPNVTEKERVSKERAAEISRELGFDEKRKQTIKSFPRVAPGQNFSDLEKQSTSEKPDDSAVQRLGSPSPGQIEAARAKNKLIQESRLHAGLVDASEEDS